MVFPENDYDTVGSFKKASGEYTFNHLAYGAEKFRYSWNFGQNWTDWATWEDTTTIKGSVFTSTDDDDLFWDGDHIIVQCKQLRNVLFSLFSQNSA